MPRSRLWLRTVGLVAGLVLALVAIRLQAQLWELPAERSALWWLLATGAALAILMDGIFGPRAITTAAPPADEPSEAAAGRPAPGGRALVPGWSRLDTVALALVLLLALLARLWRVDTIPEGIWFDESQRGLEVLKMLADASYRPIFAAEILQEPTGLWYLMMPLVALLGRDPLALRLPVVVGGTLGVGAIYLLARVLYGRRVAIVAAGLAIGFTWHLTFSRVALPAVISVACDTAAAALLVLGLRKQSRPVLGASGLVAGAGLLFYFSSQVMPLVLAAVVGHQVLVSRGAVLRRNAVGLACFAIGFLLAAGPVVSVALADPGRITARTATVSIFREVETTGSWRPLLDNIQAHLLMFGVRGDPNGRHNLSGRPMLDPVTGGLAVAGLVLALLRPWRVERALPLIWLPISLLGGVLSLSFEAPQSHRAIDALVPSLLFAALPIGLLWGEADRLGSALAARWPRVMGGLPVLGRHAVTAGLVVLALGATNAMNLGRYFGEQQPESRTWSEMAGPQTRAARQIAALPGIMPVYVEPSWIGHPTIKFLEGRPHQYLPFDPSTNLPVTDDAAAIFVADRPGLAEQLAALYPTARHTTFRVPNGGSVVGHGFVLPPEALQLHRGVAARYQGASGVVERREGGLDLDWKDAPLPAPFDATFTATLTVPSFDQYQLVLEGPPSLALTVDGMQVLRGGQAGLLPLARGNHALRLSGTGLGLEPIRLLWGRQADPPRPIAARFLNVAPVQATGLLARLYAGETAAGSPRIQQVDPVVNLQVHLLPLPRPYTIEWSGAIRIEQAGFYRFGVGDAGVFALWVDDLLLGESGTSGPIYGEADLAAGWHDLRIRFVDRSNFASVTAYWQPPGRPREVIPTRVLRPWPAGRVAEARPEDADLAVAGSASGPDDAPRLTPVAALTRPAPGSPLAELSRITGMGKPRGIAAGPDGALYVVESGREAVVRIDPDGTSRELGAGTLAGPSAVAVLPSGEVVVLDAAKGMLLRLDPDGNVGERLFPGQGFYSPRGLAATEDGRLIVADTGTNRLMIGPPGGPVEIVADVAQPTSAVLLHDGTILAAETGAARIVQFGPGGARVASWSMPPSSTVPAPQAVALPGGGWAVSAPEAQVLIVRRGADGPVEIRALGESARRPSGLLVDAAGRLVVADGETGTLRTFALP